MPDSVLVVEDDDRIRAMLRMALEDEGYEVREASSGEDGLGAMRTSPADFVIVDLMLGGMDGFSCIREVRRWSDVPIVIVSARTDTHDIVAGLESGADDYVTKPFQIKEITARLRALRRRLRPRDADAGQPAIVLAQGPGGPLVLRRAEGRLLRGQEQVHLTLTEFRLLCELARGAGPGAEPAAAARTRVGPGLLRRRAPRRRPREAAAHEDRAGSGEPGPGRHRPRPRVPPGGPLRRLGPRRLGPRRLGPRRIGTLRSRIVLAFTAGGLAVCALFAVATFSLARGYLTDQRRRVVLREATADANALRSRLATSGTTAADALAAISPGTATAVLVDRGGSWTSSLREVGPPAVPAAVRQGADAGRTTVAPARLRGGPALAVGIPVPDVDAVVYEVAPLTELRATLRVLSAVLWVGSGLGVGLAALVGLWASRRILQPLTPIAATAAAIAGGNLDRRLPATDDPDLVTMVGSFNSMVDALQQRIERDARFAADVSHELRSPLTTLVGSVDMLNARAPALPPRVQEIVRLVTAELERFQGLLEALLDLARADAGAAIDRRPLDLAELVARVLHQSGRPPHLLHVEGAPAVVRGDRIRLERAVANLLDNADRHGGGVERVVVRGEDGGTAVVVDDAGPGVAPGDRERIFERFATGGGPRRSGSGSGLGLALVHETARAHGGSAWCTDGPAAGARFVIRLPEAV